MSAIGTTGAGEAVGENAALQVVAEGLFHVSRARVHVAVPVELAATGQRASQVSKYSAAVPYSRVCPGCQHSTQVLDALRGLAVEAKGCSSDLQGYS